MFIDNLALTEGLLLFAAAVLTYLGVSVWWAMRTNQPDKVHAALKGGALPIGAIGFTGLVLGFWEEMVWPYPASMGGYNILFNDMTVLFGVVMLSFAVVAYIGLRLQYVGVFAFMAGAIVFFYGWTGYGFHYTKDPFDTLLLYGSFGLAGVVCLPATIVVDYYVGTVAKSSTAWRTSSPSFFGRRAMGARAATRVGLSPTAEPSGASTTSLRFGMPIALQLLVWVFPIVMALAGIAAWYYLGVTLPGHLTPGSTP
jgi:uncharacterized membrane protein